MKHKDDPKPGDLFKVKNSDDYDLAMFLSYAEDGRQLNFLKSRLNYTPNSTIGLVFQLSPGHGWVKVDDEQ